MQTSKNRRTGSDRKIILFQLCPLYSVDIFGIMVLHLRNRLPLDTVRKVYYYGTYLQRIQRFSFRVFYTHKVAETLTYINI